VSVIPAKERVKKSKLQPSVRPRSVIPTKAGIDFSRWNKTLAWVPAFAGTTLQPGFQPGSRFFHTLFRGKDAAVRSLAVPHRGGQHFLRLL